MNVDKAAIDLHEEARLKNNVSSANGNIEKIFANRDSNYSKNDNKF